MVSFFEIPSSPELRLRATLKAAEVFGLLVFKKDRVEKPLRSLASAGVLSEDTARQSQTSASSQNPIPYALSPYS